MDSVQSVIPRPRLMLFGLAVALLGLASILVPTPAPAHADISPDYAVRGGHFFSQTGAGKGGFGVRDMAGVQFWTEYERLGGPDALGYPISRPFWGPGGFLYQAFQRALLQWRPETGGAYLANTLEIIEGHDQALNKQLFESYSIPYSRQPKAGTFQQEAAERLSWLTNEQIKAAFLTNPVNAQTWEVDSAMAYYGLPQSEPRRTGPFIIQRFQRIPLQLWVDRVTGMPAPGSVVGVLSGELAKVSGAVPRDAAVPEPLAPPLAEAELSGL